VDQQTLRRYKCVPLTLAERGERAFGWHIEDMCQNLCDEGSVCACCAA
jgi:hypothetical protein